MLLEHIETDLSALARKMELPVTTGEFLNQAFTTPLHSQEINPLLPHQKNLALLGDAAIRHTVAAFVVANSKPQQVDTLTPIISIVVSTINLGQIGETLELHRYLRVGHAEGLLLFTDDFERYRIYSETLEAVVGAIDLNIGGVHLAAFFESFLFPLCRDLLQRPAHTLVHPKSLLQRLAGAKWKRQPKYITRQSRTNRQLFFCECSIGRNIIGKGSGPAKKEAEKHSALNALQRSFAHELTELDG